MTESQHILFDEAHGQRRWGDTGFSPHTLDAMYSSLAEFGETALALKSEKNVTPFNKDSLRNARVVVLPNPAGRLDYWRWLEEPDTKFTTAECQTLWNYVADGGRLLILAHRHADAFTQANLNVLSQPFGFEFLPRVFVSPAAARKGESWAPVTTSISPHPITDQVHVACLNHCCPIRITNPEMAKAILWPPSKIDQLDLSGDPNNEADVTAGVVSTLGAGRVVAFGSDVMFGPGLNSGNDEFHNDRLIQNALRYLAAEDSAPDQAASPKVFLSHQSADKDFTRRLAHDLLERGFDVWFDEFRLKIGDSLTESIDRAVGECDFLVLVISKTALESKWVNKEYASANAHMLDGGCLKILPAVIDDCQIPTFLKDVLWADFRSDYPHALEMLASAIEEHFRTHPMSEE